MGKRNMARVMVFMLLICSAGLARADTIAPGAPALADPDALYDEYVMQLGDDELIDLATAVNDITQAVELYGSLTHRTVLLDYPGVVTEIGAMCVNGVRVIRIFGTDGAMSQTNYCAEDAAYDWANGVLTPLDVALIADEFNVMWQGIWLNWGLTVEMRVRREGEYTYILCTPYDPFAQDASYKIEYVFDSGMRVVENRAYSLNEQNVLALYSHTRYLYGEEPELPEMLADAIEARADKPASDIKGNIT